jgi:hypothetical protein
MRRTTHICPQQTLTLAEISPFLQIIRIANQPLQPWLLINIYTPLNEEDLPLIPTIQNTITDHINTHLDPWIRNSCIIRMGIELKTA